MKSLTTSAAASNIVPVANYVAGSYTLNGLIVGRDYKWTKGANDTSIVVNGSITLTASGMFTATATSVTLTGSGTSLITAMVSLTCGVNLYPSTFTPSVGTRQVTCGEFPSNPNWSRQHQVSDEAHFVKRAGASAVAILLADFSNLALTQEVGLTWTPPVVLTQPVAAVCTGNASASGTLTNDGTNVSDGDTVTIGGKIYTFQATLTNVDGNVKIGASNTASMTNLFHAINASGGTPGTDYATAMTANAYVTATNPTGTTVVVTAIAAGAGGNAIATTEASTHLSWGAATLTGGTATAKTFTVAVASEYDVTYQWQYSTDGTNWTNIAGTVNGTPFTGYTTATLSTGVPTTQGNNGVYIRCVVTDDAGLFGLTNGSVNTDGHALLTIY